MGQGQTQTSSFFQRNPHASQCGAQKTRGSFCRQVSHSSSSPSIRLTCGAFSSLPLLTRDPPPGVPREAHQRLCGGLLGDGSLEMYRHPKTEELVSVRYREKHSVAQADLVFNQQKGLRPLTDKIKTPVVRQDRRHYSFLEVRTSRTPSLKVYGEAFYRSEKQAGKWKNTKHLPDTIGELLDNPMSLGVWIAGDGNPHGKTLSLCTQSFSEADHEVLKDVLKQNFGVEARVVSHSNGVKYYSHLYLPREQAAKLIAHCDPQFRDLPSLTHKFVSLESF